MRSAGHHAIELDTTSMSVWTLMTSGLDAIQYGNSYSEWYAIISTGPHIVDLSALLLFMVISLIKYLFVHKLYTVFFSMFQYPFSTTSKTVGIFIFLQDK